jgi:outer membrane protein assembly factor BamB
MKAMHSNTNSRRIGAGSLAVVLALALSGCGAFGGKGKPTTPTVGNRIPILSRVDTGAKVDPALAALSVIVPPAVANTDWAQAGGTANKSYGNLALAAAPQRAWTAKIAGSDKKQRLAAAPVVGGGQLYAMDTAGVVRAFDAQTGAQRWSAGFQIKGDGANSVYGGGASYDNGRLYVTTGMGEVAALDAKTGNVIWKVKPAGPLRGSPTIAYNSVFVMTMDNQLWSLNAEDGAPLWNETASTG